MIDFSVKQTKKGLAVTIDPDLAHDIVVLLDALVDLVKVMRCKAEAQAVAREIRLKRNKKKTDREFDLKSRAVLARYNELIVRCDDQTARVLCQGEFGCDTLTGIKYLLMRGRQLARKEGKRPRRDPRGAQNHVLEVKAA